MEANQHLYKVCIHLKILPLSHSYIILTLKLKLSLLVPHSICLSVVNTKAPFLDTHMTKIIH